MRVTKILFSIVIGFLATVTVAQNYDFGKVSPTEVAATSDPDFPDANAVVLYRYVNTYLGNYVEVHERIKIFNEEGFDKAQITIPYADVGKVKGATYNYENGQVVETKLDKDLIFTDEVIKGIDIKKFTFPNVKAGSVLELFYTSKKGTLKDISLQYDIPIKKIVVKITNRSQAQTEILQNPRAFLNVNRKRDGGQTIISASNVVPLEEENYVYDMDMYRHYLKINLISLTDTYTFSNWKTLFGTLMDNSDFKYALKKKNIYKDDVQALMSGVTDPIEKMEKIYNYLRNYMKWDGSYGMYPAKSIKDLYNAKEGSMADINALFISMLESVDIDADPVFVSTKLNGIPLTASLSAFNGLIAGVKMDGKLYLFDVACNLSSFDDLDPGLRNWKGAYIDQKDRTFDWVDLMSSEMAMRSVMASIEIDEDLVAVGKAREHNAGYYAASAKHRLKDLSETEMDDILSYDMEGLEVMEVRSNEKGKDLDFDFDFEYENGVDEIDGKLYLSPLLFFGMQENPFQKDERLYPIDFGYAFRNQAMLNLKIPEGYQVESVPSPTKLVLPDDRGSFIYRISANGQTVQVSTVFQINESVLPHDSYTMVKEFFKARMEKEQEQLVLTKI